MDAPVFDITHEASVTVNGQTERMRSNRSLQAQKNDHSILVSRPESGEAQGPPRGASSPRTQSAIFDHSTESNEEVESLRQVVASLQAELQRTQNMAQQHEDMAPQPHYRAPSPTPFLHHKGEEEDLATPYQNGRITSHAEFVKLKKLHTTPLREVSSTPRKILPANLSNERAISPRKVVVREAGCAPNVSNKEFTKKKLGHTVSHDSPLRRRASDVPPAGLEYSGIIDSLSPEKPRSHAKWPAHLPHNVLQILQGVWESRAPPLKRFVVKGEGIYVDGVLSVHRVVVGAFGLHFADACVQHINSDTVEWDCGDIWVRPGFRGNIPTKRAQPTPHPRQNQQKQRQDQRTNANQEERRGGNSPQSVCVDCNQSASASPFCPISGRPHEGPEMTQRGGGGGVFHSTQGRCPNGHKLAIQHGVGDVSCSSCELILPAERFAGCRECDYDVCDCCLGCAEGSATCVMVQRSPDEGTGAICAPSMLLEEVVPGSPADISGMQALIGKKLTHVNGIPVYTIGEACSVAQKDAAVEMRFE